MTKKIAVVGAGAWGTALALVAEKAGNKVTLIARDAKRAAVLKKEKINKRDLPSVKLPAGITVTDDIAKIKEASIVIIATPAQFVGKTIEILAKHLSLKHVLILAAKGFEQKSGKMLIDIIKQKAPNNPLAILSGPSFAIDVARGKPTAITIAAASLALAQDLCKAFQTKTFRPYPSSDLIGVHVGGSIKNVLAIACGVAHGLKLGENAKASLLTRGLAEMTRLAVKMGSRPETLYGLSGLGDLVLTSTSMESRNFSLGVALGAGKALPKKLAEGLYTAEAIYHLSKKLNVPMPISEAVYAILYKNKKPQQCVVELLSRPLQVREL